MNIPIVNITDYFKNFGQNFRINYPDVLNSIRTNKITTNGIGNLILVYDRTYKDKDGNIEINDMAMFFMKDFDIFLTIYKEPKSYKEIHCKDYYYEIFIKKSENVIFNKITLESCLDFLKENNPEYIEYILFNIA